MVFSARNWRKLKYLRIYYFLTFQDFEKNFYLTGAHNKLSCHTPIPASILSTVSGALKKDTTTTQELYFNYYAMKNIGSPIDDATKDRVAKFLHAILKTDDSLSR